MLMNSSGTRTSLLHHHWQLEVKCAKVTSIALLDCLEGNLTNSYGTSLDVDCKVLDGPAVVHLLVPGTYGTSDDYAKEVFLPYVVKELDTVSRIDIVWDVYKSDSLKNATREKSSCGTRRRVSSSTRIPGN